MERKAYYRIGDKLLLKTETLPEPQANEVQVAVKAIGLNFADIFSILGLYKAAPKGEFVPGLEFSGEITKVGGEVRDFKIGQRVMGVRRFGAYATCVNVSAEQILPLPDSWSFEEGAAYPVQMLTAYYGLVVLGRVARGETVLIQSAAGGVGLAALKIAKKYECFVVGMVGDESKMLFCREHGYDEVLVRDGLLKKNLERVLGDRSLDIVMECSGGQVFRDCLSVLSPRGRMIVYGFSRYMPKGNLSYPRLILQYLFRPKLDIEKLDNRSVSVFNLINLFDKADEMKRLLDEVESLGLAKPHIGHTYPFEELPQAVLELKSGKTQGKSVVAI